MRDDEGIPGLPQKLPGDEIYNKVRESILRNRIGPGVKLAELKLVETFGVNRETVRRALIRLASDGIVDYFPKRGAYVASPTVSQVEEVLDARLGIESKIVADLAADVSGADVAALVAFVESEKSCHDGRDYDRAVELSGTFHVKLAQLSGNSFYIKYLSELSALTCLALMKYDIPSGEGCPYRDHFELVTALRNGQATRATNIVRRHLRDVHEKILARARTHSRARDISGLLAT